MIIVHTNSGSKPPPILRRRCIEIAPNVWLAATKAVLPTETLADHPSVRRIITSDTTKPFGLNITGEQLKITSLI